MTDLAANESSYPKSFFCFLLSPHPVTQSWNFLMFQVPSHFLYEVIKCALQQYFLNQRRLEPTYCKHLDLAAVYNLFIIILYAAEKVNLCSSSEYFWNRDSLFNVFIWMCSSWSKVIFWRFMVKARWYC